MFRFPFQPMGLFDLFVTGRSHLLLSERSLSFNNVMITLTSTRSSIRIVELAYDLVLQNPKSIFKPGKKNNDFYKNCINALTSFPNS